MRIEVSIDRLVVDGRIAGSADELLAALTGELGQALARELSLRHLSQHRRLTGAQAITVPRLRTVLPPSEAGVSGRAIGAALASAVTGDQVLGARTPRTNR